MRNLIQKFKKSESGASLVEYAVALIVVTIVGGAGVIAIGGDAGGLADLACDITAAASDAAEAAPGTGTTALNDTACG